MVLWDQELTGVWTLHYIQQSPVLCRKLPNKQTLDGWRDPAVILQVHDFIDIILASTSSRHIKELCAHSRWKCLANLFFYCIALAPGNIHKHTHHSHVPTPLASRPILLPSIHCPLISRSASIISLTKTPHPLLHTHLSLPFKADSSVSSLPAFGQIIVVGGCPVYHPGLCPLDASCNPCPRCDYWPLLSQMWFKNVQTIRQWWWLHHLVNILKPLNCILQIKLTNLKRCSDIAKCPLRGRVILSWEPMFQRKGR